jgi:hypothetical protein
MIAIRCYLLSVFCLLAAGSVAADTDTEITTALDYFAQIWNEGDLDAIRKESVTWKTLRGPARTGVCSAIRRLRS